MVRSTSLLSLVWLKNRLLKMWLIRFFGHLGFVTGLGFRKKENQNNWCLVINMRIKN